MASNPADARRDVRYEPDERPPNLLSAGLSVAGSSPWRPGCRRCAGSSPRRRTGSRRHELIQVTGWRPLPASSPMCRPAPPVRRARLAEGRRCQVSRSGWPAFQVDWIFPEYFDRPGSGASCSSAASPGGLTVISLTRRAVAPAGGAGRRCISEDRCVPRAARRAPAQTSEEMTGAFARSARRRSVADREPACSYRPHESGREWFVEAT